VGNARGKRRRSTASRRRRLSLAAVAVIVAASGAAGLMRLTGLTGATQTHSAAADSRLTHSGAAGSGMSQAAGTNAAGASTTGPAGVPDTISAVAPGLIPPAVMSAMNRARHVPRAATSSPVGKFNVNEPHSPQVLRQLSGPLSKTGRPGRAAAPAKTAAPSSRATATPAPGSTASATPAPEQTATARPAPSTSAQANTTALVRPAATAGTSGTLPLGVDVASFQHPTSTQYPNGAPIDWTQVASAGIKFASVKATEGNYYTNPYYGSDLAGAKAAGLYVTGYHFASPHVSSGINQADYAVANGHYTADGQTLPLELDLENDPYSTNQCYLLTQPQMVSWISAFDAEAQRLTGQLPIIYTTAAWWNTCTGGSKAFAPDQLRIASYSTPNPAMPAAWPNWTFWQYTSAATVAGITGNADESYFNSDQVVDLIDPGTQRDAPGSLVSSLQINSLNTAAGQSLTYTASGLPSGLSISSAGQITGTISASAAPAAYKVVVTGTNPSSGATGSASFVWEVPGTVTVTSPANQATTIGSAAGVQVQATDTASGYSPSFTATGLPSGVSISSTGRISGWPATAGTYSVTVTGTDAMNVSGSAAFSWTVSTAPNQGPAGQVWLQNGGKCLDDPSGRTASGTRLQVWRCLGDAYQRWTVVQDGTLRINGACLAEAGTGNGSAVVLNVCDRTSGQRWQVGTSGQLVNTASGRCLDDTGWGTANGTLVQMWACTGGADQHWIPAAAAAMSGIPGKCLDDPGFSTANGTRLDIWACSGGGNQRVTVEPDGSIHLSGKCLDVAGAGTASGTPLDLYTCVGSANQHWKIVPMGPLGSQVVNPASGKCLADAGGATANGSRLTIQACPQAQDPGTTWHVL
jgi:GH25 family lysozyme M1 (1,4-beta-N-acetylmuramidase)